MRLAGATWFARACGLAAEVGRYTVDAVRPDAARKVERELPGGR